MDDQQYWRANRRLILVLMGIWAFLSLICSTILIETLNQIKFFGVPFGFWMAQQGTIYVFLGLIAVYVWQMEKLDRAHSAWRESQGGEGI